ncbi:uncharacterized protein LOC106136629 [Amyelois transitella]|uniref:uncharacterized protein LOC106136629 n=1 Tax=Amyelois transitella TaxID=680683 RepID=UPI00067C77B8|nr:uncharacterized protein LOC106136629 [Amyelois transitella]
MEPSPKPKACRQLFPEEQPNKDYQKVIEENLQRHLEEQKRKWNFDFSTERMISDDGSYIWSEGDERYDWIGRPYEHIETDNPNDILEENLKISEDQSDKSDEEIKPNERNGSDNVNTG